MLCLFRKEKELSHYVISFLQTIPFNALWVKQLVLNQAFFPLATKVKDNYAIREPYTHGERFHLYPTSANSAFQMMDDFLCLSFYFFSFWLVDLVDSQVIGMGSEKCHG